MVTGPSAETLAVEISGLGFAVEGRQILSGVDLHVGARERVALVGPNGSGKSTLLRCMHGWHRPSEGRVLLGGADVTRMSGPARARAICVLTQDNEAGLGLTVGDIVALGARVRGLGAQAEADLVDARLRAVGLGGWQRRDMATLSGGERQRVMLARALAQGAAVLALDEPTNHLDIRHQLDMLDLVGGWDGAVIATLHDLGLAARWADRVYVLHAGRIARAGPPGAVLTPELLREVYAVDAVRDADPRTARPRLTFYRQEAGR